MNPEIEAFLASLTNRSPATQKTYRAALLAFSRTVGDDALSINQYVQFLQETTNINKGTQRLYRSVLHSLFDFHDITGNLNKADRLHAQRGGVRLPVFDRDAVEKTIQYATTIRNGLLDLRDRAFILTLAHTGLRISEACALVRGQIDWKEQRAIIIGKGDKQDVVRFSNRSIEALKSYLAERGKLDGSTGKPLASLPLFARHDPEGVKKLLPVGKSGMWSAIKGRMTEAGVDPATVRIHDFRHYFVTRVYLATGDIMIAKTLARHASIDTTGRYAHVGDTGEVYHEIFNV